MDRKVILQQLEVHFGEKPKYMGPPSFAYQVKAGNETYTIDREGKITNDKGTEMELEVLVGVASVAATPERAILDEAYPEAETLESQVLDGVEVVLPLKGHTGASLKNLVNIITAKQSLIQQAFGLAGSIIDEEFAWGINEKEIRTAEDFKDAILEIETKKCPGLAFDFEEGTITYKFYEGEVNPDKLKAYTDLVVAINNNAQTLKHSTMKATATDNPKYSFRTWLLRLGMIGHEYKTTRKVLLANLEGNGAFRKGGVNG